MRAYHWTSLGSHDGFAFTLPEFSGQFPSITSLDSKNAVILVALEPLNGTCHARSLHIKRQETQFQFREKKSKRTIRDECQTTFHNSLIDCHADVWTRFPVVPAVQRRVIDLCEDRKPLSLFFVVEGDTSPFVSYFKDLIQTFEKNTKKPTAAVLDDIAINAGLFTTVVLDLTFGQGWDGISSFKAGQWTVEIFCLIPIHIAIARDNRFIPLKDGVWAPEVERSLLGAEVGRIVDSLSFGWYESIFQSYMSTKVSSLLPSLCEESKKYLACKGCIIDG